MDPSILPDLSLEDDLLDLSLNEGPQASFNALTLVGRIISDRILNFKAVKSILNASWNLGLNVQIVSLEPNKISCNFNKEADRDRILNASPWAIKGHILVLQHWSPSVTISELDFSHSPFWVQIHNIPPNRQNLENAKRLGAFIGTFVDFDDRHPVTTFLRIRATINTAHPLKSGTFIRRDNGSI